MRLPKVDIVSTGSTGSMGSTGSTGASTGIAGRTEGPVVTGHSNHATGNDASTTIKELKSEIARILKAKDVEVKKEQSRTQEAVNNAVRKTKEDDSRKMEKVAADFNKQVQHAKHEACKNCKQTGSTGATGSTGTTGSTGATGSTANGFGIDRLDRRNGFGLYWSYRPNRRNGFGLYWSYRPSETCRLPIASCSSNDSVYQTGAA